MQLLPNGFFPPGRDAVGSVLPEEVALSNGIGPGTANGRRRASAVAPAHTRVSTTEQELEIGGRPFILRWSPGETLGHCRLWLPDHRVLFVGDNLYKAFPNLYTLRGNSPRPVRRWIETLDEMRRLQPRPELLVLGHTAPIAGADAIYQLLTDYRDAIAFVHDSVVRGINAGKNPQQLAREIRLPAAFGQPSLPPRALRNAGRVDSRSLLGLHGLV